MSPLFESIALWLADVHLLGGALLAVVLPALLLLRQPAQRMALAKSALAALAALVVLCALPGWSLVHILSAEAPPTSVAVAVSEPSAEPFTAPGVQYDPKVDAYFFPAPPPDEVASAAPAPEATTLPTISWPATLVLLQAGGSAAVVAWLAAGAIMVRRVRSTSQPASPELQRLLAEVSGAGSPPSLLVSARVSTPVALGLRRPAILLPANLVQPPALPVGSATNDVAQSATVGDNQRPATPGQSPGLSVPPPPGLTAILAHEYAHVAAGDLRTLALARLLLAIFWAQALFWLLRRCIRFDQESLADAAAAEVAGRLSYAEQLIGWAREVGPRGRAPRLAGAVGLWEGPSQLKRRISLLLDEKLTVLRTASRRWRIGTACAALVAAALLSLVTVQRQEVIAADSTTDAAPTPAMATAPAPPVADATPSTVPITVRGRAFTSVGKPLAGATIYLASLRGDWKRLGGTTSKADGSYEFRDVPLPIEPPRDKLGVPVGAFEVFGLADGRAFAYRPLKWFRPNQKHYDDRELMFMEDRPHGFGAEDPIVLDLKFAEPQTLAGRLVDDAGQPIAGATLAIRYMSMIPKEGYAREDDFDRMSPADECESFNERAIVPPTFKTQQTDADGRFEFTRLPENVRFRMDISASGFPDRSEWAATRTGAQKYEGGTRAHVGVMDLTLRRPKDVAMQVVYEDTGEPAPNVFVNASNKEAGTWKSSDDSGLVHFPLPTGTYKVTLVQQYQTPYLRTEGELIVDDTSDETPTIIRLRRAAEVKVTVKDATTGAPIEGVALWSRSATGAVGRHRRVGYRSWEEATRISHYEEPRTGADGVATALFEPGDYVIGLASETFPARYKAVQAEGKQVTCVAGLTEGITLELQSTVPAASDDGSPISPTLDFVPEPSLNLVPPTAPADDQGAGASGIPGGTDRAAGAVTFHRVGDATPTTIASNNALRAAGPLQGSTPAGGILRTLEPLYGAGAARLVELDKPETRVNAYTLAGQPLLVREVGGGEFLTPADGSIDANASNATGQSGVLDTLSPASDEFRARGRNPDGGTWFLVAAPAPADAAQTTPSGGSLVASGTFVAFPAPDADALKATVPAASNATAAQHELRVRVTDADGRPLAGAKVFQNHVRNPPVPPASGRKTDIKNQDYVTDREGVAVVSWPGESVDLRLWVSHSGYVPLHAMWAKQFQSDGDKIPAEFTFAMERGTKIGGVVLDDKGRPIEGAKVDVHNAGALVPIGVADTPGVRPVATQGLGSVVTDAEGRWTADTVPADADLQSPTGGLGTTPAEIGPAIRLKITHPGFVAFEGTRPAAANAPKIEALRALTAEVQLAAKPPAAATPEGSVATAPPTPPTWFRFEPNVAQGRVCDPDSQPLAGVEVTLYRHQLGDRGSGEAPQAIAVQTTGPDGLYRFENALDVAKEFPDGLPDERFVSSPVRILIVVGRAPGRASAWNNDSAHNAVRRGFTEQLIMDRAATLAGRITTREGAPVANALVKFALAPFQADDLIQTARTDADGRYAISDLPPYDAEATKRKREEQVRQDPNLAWTLVNMAINVHVEHPDFATASATVKKIPGTVDLQLPPASVIEGVVVIGDRTGVALPAANVMVHLMRQRDPQTTPAQLNLQAVRTASVKTDAAGRYRFGSLPAGSYVMNGQSEGYVCKGLRDVKVGEGATVTAPELTLTRGGTVRIKLVDANTKKPMSLPDGTRGYVYPHPQSPLPSQNVVTFTNAVGETHVPAGRYGFMVSIPGTTPTDPYWQSVDFPTTPPEISHEVKEGETVEVEVLIKRQDQQAMATGTLQLYAPAATPAGEDDEAAEEPAAPAAPATTPAANQGSSTGGLFDTLNPALDSVNQAEVILAPLDEWGYGVDGGKDSPRW
jgi:beta-lactamase regulating signal transducer with metallopeptidase domain